MKLHENPKLFSQAVRATAEKRELLDIYIEKDYWVTFALKLVFTDKLGDDAVFKGGTALSKCYKLIERFSEDIDLVVLKKEGESGNKLSNKIRNIGKLVGKTLSETHIEGLTHKVGMNRKTVHSYNKQFKGDFGQVRDAIVLEATWLGSHDPYIEHTVSSYIYEMLVETEQLEIIKENEMEPFPVRVLAITRTLCEKIMSLVRFSYGDNPIEELKKKVRHIYDIHKLLEDKEVLDFFESKGFEDMLIKVATDDVESYKNNNEWLVHHPSKSKIFSELGDVWVQLEIVYNSEFKRLVYGELPPSPDVLVSLIKVQERLEDVVWTIEL
jgi:predicted nucleotidyltransferase component of viral defense system